MFPQGELNLIAQEKARLQRISADHRATCVVAARELARPIAQLDEWRERWERWSPWLNLAGLAAGVGSSRSGSRARGGIGRWLRWGTTILKAVRQWRSARAG